MAYVVAVLALVSAGQTWLLWRILCAVGSLDKVADESVRVSRTLHLLMETTESGFATFGGILSEALQPLRRRRSSAQKRASRATTHGAIAQTVSDVDRAWGRVRAREGGLMARCTRSDCRRWYPDALVSFGVGATIEGAWYCSQRCLQSTMHERIERLGRTTTGSTVQGFPPIRLGALLLAGESRLAPEQLAQALKAQRTSGRKLGAELLHMGAITPADLVSALARQANTKCLTAVDPAIARAGHGGLSRDMVRALGLVPFASRPEARLLKVAFTAPVPRVALAALHELTGWTPDPYLVADEVWPQLVDAYATGSTDERIYTTASAPTFEDGLAHVARLAVRVPSARISQARLDTKVWVRVEAPGHVDDVLMAVPSLDEEETRWQTAPTLH